MAQTVASSNKKRDDIPDGVEEGSPAEPNTGSLVSVNAEGTFTPITAGLDRPTSFELVGNTAYIVTLTGEVWTIDKVTGPPFGVSANRAETRRSVRFNCT